MRQIRKLLAQALVGISLASLGLPVVAGFWDSEPDSDGPLTVDQAFELYPAVASDGQLKLEWRIAPEHYLYRFRLKIVNAADDSPLTAQWPEGLPYHDEHFGDVTIYREQLTGAVTLSGPPPARIRVTYQGCADAGLCYPPQTRELEVEQL